MRLNVLSILLLLHFSLTIRIFKDTELEILKKFAEKSKGECPPWACSQEKMGGIRKSETSEWMTKEDGLLLYRMFTESREKEHQGMAKKMGAWWSLEKPSGTKADFYKNNAVCEEWNFLNKLVVCTIKKNFKFFVGKTQSAKCPSEKILGANETFQVFIPEGQDIVNWNIPVWGEKSPFSKCEFMDGPLK